MSHNIPVSLVSNIGSYELDMQGAKVKVSVVDNSAVIEAKIEEFKCSLKTLQRRVVGLDIKFVETISQHNIAVKTNVKFGKCFFSKKKMVFKTISQKDNTAMILLLCVGTNCLIIQLPNFPILPETLVQFLSDETICFLGTGMNNIVSDLNRRYSQRRNVQGNIVLINGPVYVKCKTGVDIGYLAAKIMRKPDIEKNGIAELAGEVGMDIKQPIGKCPDWNAKVFSDEEIKYAMHNAYTSYVIGNKLFGMV
jgi:hypothetical protein